PGAAGPQVGVRGDVGIRDFHVTGVQTCALPIWPLPTALRSSCLKSISARPGCQAAPIRPMASSTPRIAAAERHPADRLRATRLQIGRASCREQAETAGAGVAVGASYVPCGWAAL